MKLAELIIARVTRRPPDFTIGGHVRPYLRRWWLTPWRAPVERAKTSRSKVVRMLGRLGELLPNVHLHQFMRSDDDRALHDHPWSNASILLRGCYVEHSIAAGGIEKREFLQAGDFRVRLFGKFAHRVELVDGPCWTLFITGPRYREWGFHCPAQGWIHWKRFTAADDPGAIGKGCDA